MHRILIIEDDQDLRTITNVHLMQVGHYSTDTAGSCEEALRCVRANSYSLILMDVLLPDGNGSDLCREIRGFCHTPIIFVSGLDDSATVVSALSNGGDDYVVKPVNYTELLARIEANIRRAGSQQSASQEPALRVFRQFSIDPNHRTVLRNGVALELSATEYGLLLYFVDHPDVLLLYDELYQQVWQHDSAGDVRTVMVHISNLRKKIDPDHTGIIQTVRGAGYIFTDK